MIHQNWEELKYKLKRKYSELTDLDLNYKVGKEEELLSSLSKKLEKTKEEIIDTLEELQSVSGKKMSTKTK